MNPDEIARALLTASLNDTLSDDAVAMVTRENMAAVLGATIALAGNMVKLVAAGWETEPEQAWEIILSSVREMGWQ